jgi:putative peptidoglycan lipid II flippase
MMIVLRRPIVNLLFQYGRFGADAREATQEAFLFYSLGLAGHALIQILTRAYYASKDTRTPLALTLVSIGTNIVLSVLLAPLYGINGLALANSIATLAEAVLFFVLLAPRARLRIVGLGTASLKVVAASLLMGIAMFAFIRATNITVDLQQTKVGLALQTAVAIAVGVLAYVGAATVFRVSELAEITAAVRSRIGRR